MKSVIFDANLQSELEYYKNHRHELVMWQLLYSYHQKHYKLITNYNRIVNTIKIALPDNIIVDIQWPADLQEHI